MKQSIRMHVFVIYCLVTWSVLSLTELPAFAVVITSRDILETIGYENTPRPSVGSIFPLLEPAPGGKQALITTGPISFGDPGEINGFHGTVTQSVFQNTTLAVGPRFSLTGTTFAYRFEVPLNGDLSGDPRIHLTGFDGLRLGTFGADYLNQPGTDTFNPPARVAFEFGRAGSGTISWDQFGGSLIGSGSQGPISTTVVVQTPLVSSFKTAGNLFFQNGESGQIGGLVVPRQFAPVSASEPGALLLLGTGLVGLLAWRRKQVKAHSAQSPTA
jgi:hypothetical protein